MMKQFVLKGLSAGILAAVSVGSYADTFELEELPTADNYRNSFPQAMNDQGHVVGISQYPKDVDIDLTQLSESLLASVGIEDPENVENLTQSQYEFILGRTAVNANINFEQLQISQYSGFLNDGVTQSELLAAEQDSISVDSFFYDINSANSIVGSMTAPFYPIDFSYVDSNDEQVDKTFYVRDYISRAVWYRDGQSTTIEPPETAELGGESAILDINESGLAAGYASTAVSPFAQERIDTCSEEDADNPATEPAQVCIHKAWFDLYTQTASNIAPSFFSRSEYLARRSIYDIRGYLWQLDSNGEVISSTELGTLTERREDDNKDFSSYAFAVNNNGIAVGQSWTYHPERGAIRMPAIFQNGEALPVTESDSFFWGGATDINDSNRAVGYLVENRSGNLRNRGFYYDLDSGELTELPGYFAGSSTVPNAINSDGIIVGTGEFEATLQSTRRRSGFWYDSNAEQPQFIDLNNALACDSPYFIVEGNDVTDSGEVLATALKTEEYVDDNGDTQSREISVSIKLDPVEGELNNCLEEENRVERSGAAIGGLPLALLALFGGLITFTRRNAEQQSKKS